MSSAFIITYFSRFVNTKHCGLIGLIDPSRFSRRNFPFSFPSAEGSLRGLTEKSEEPFLFVRAGGDGKDAVSRFFYGGAKQCLIRRLGR